MGNTKTRTEWKKVLSGERFSLFQDKADRTHFSARSKDSAGKWIRRRFHASSVDEAAAHAPKALGFVASSRAGGHQLVDAFNEALAASSRGDRARQDWNKEVRRFITWLATHQPGCTHWHLLDRATVRAYLASLKHLADHTRRLRLQPIRQTARFMHAEYDVPDVTQNLRTGSKLKHEPPMVSLLDVVGFLDWLREHRPLLEAGAALQGLAGLQLQEATRLTWDRVDLGHGLIEVSGEVKNAYRCRVIPVADRVLEALVRARELQKSLPKPKVQDVQEHVLVTSSGTAYTGGSWMNYSSAMGLSLRTWNPQLDWKPKDLRNAVLTFAQTEGLLSDLWEQYVGHAPRSVTARHYTPRLTSRSKGEHQALGEAMAVFKQHVVDPINEAVRGGRQSRFNIFQPEANGPTDEVKRPKTEKAASP